MFNMRFQAPSLGKMLLIRVAIAIIAVYSFGAIVSAQSAPGNVPPTNFRIGEKLSYNVSFEKFQNVAYLETYVVSFGKFSGKDVVEIRGRLKTLEFVSAAFSLVDENRTVYCSPDLGIPLYISRTLNDGVVPKEMVNNYLTSPTTGYDLLTLIYKIREAGGNGSFTLVENGDTYVVTVQGTKSEKVRTEAGEFETGISTVQSPYLDGLGIKSLTINLSSDENRLPVLIRFKSAKGNYKAELSGVQNIAPEVPVHPSPTPMPMPVATPRPTQTPQPKPTEEPYVENQPLLPELSFALGETLEYKVTNNNQAVATIRLIAQERKLFQNLDSLKLTATVTGIQQGTSTFAVGDAVTTQVDPVTLAPQQFELKFGAVLKELNKTVSINPKTGAISYGGTNPVDAPIGTHNLISLVYAMRSFNLEPSINPASPVNDTRVAVFWNDRPYIFSLRPGYPELITIGSEKVSAQMVTINTGSPQLDPLAIKVWLSTDARRVPLRFSVGTFQADLTAISRTQPN